jgi:FkbM family methyltransferase
VIDKSIIRFWVPVPRLRPFKTFPRRTIEKQKWIFQFCSKRIGALLSLSGAKVDGKTLENNYRLRLNSDCALGSKGFVLEMPRDETIFNKVRYDSSYDLEESQFLSRGLIKASNISNAKVALLDIGANVGLVTLQAMNIAQTKNDVFCFEPIPQHASALRSNLSQLAQRVRVNIHEVGLSDHDTSATIFTESTNHGNSSLIQDVVPEGGRRETSICLVDTKSFFERNFQQFTAFIVKCDTQGMDALILSRLPEFVWLNIVCAEIEVWALADVNPSDVDMLLSMLTNFDVISWSPNEVSKLEISDIRDYWLSKSGEWKNLYLSKSS